MLKNLIDAVQSAHAKPTLRSIPIFPLGAVLFPGGLMSLKVFETRYVDMVKASLKHNQPFGISLIREGKEVGAPAVPEPVGTVAVIEDWDMKELGVLQIRVRGLSRYRIQSTEVAASGLVVAAVTDIADDTHASSTPLARCASFLAKVIAGTGGDIHAASSRFDDAFWVSMRLTELLPLGNQVKQKMLELTDATMRLEVLERFLADQGLIPK
jgi:Lon protease-like protein